MKKNIALLLLCCCVILNSCTTSQLGAAATGTSLGGMFGSSIGGLAGGYKGHQIGTLVGMTTGAAVGIAAATPKTNNGKKEEKKQKKSSVEYGTYEHSGKGNHAYANEHPLEVTQIIFTDANNNHYLEAYESGALEITFINRGNMAIYKFAPKVSCDNRHIDIAPLSPVEEMEPQQRIRYRVELVGKKKLKAGTTKFEIIAKNGKIKEVIKSFEIETNK